MIGGIPLAAHSPAADAAKPVAEVPVPKLPQPARGISPVLKLALLLVIVGAGYFGWQQFKPAPATSEPAPKAPPAAKAVGPAPATTPAPTPSETLNKLAHVPANAINQAQEAIATRRASGQARIDAASIGEDLPTPTAGAAPAEVAKQPATPRADAPTTSTTIAPGVAATTQLAAGAEASQPFRSFVANAKVSGVFQGTPSRAVINGRLMRAGEVVDGTLGITFEGVDAERRHLVFKDKSGATVSRRF
jgi:cytoskeletal protein RodZ